jgi:hypothetical protein
MDYILNVISSDISIAAVLSILSVLLIKLLKMVYKLETLWYEYNNEIIAILNRIDNAIDDNTNNDTLRTIDSTVKQLKELVINKDKKENENV